jgi:hypothetical protein
MNIKCNYVVEEMIRISEVLLCWYELFTEFLTLVVSLLNLFVVPNTILKVEEGDFSNCWLLRHIVIA